MGVLNREWSLSGNLLDSFKVLLDREKHIKWRNPLELARGVGSNVPWLLFLSSSVNECRGDLFVWGREQRGSLISTPFYLWPTAPATQPCVLSHAGVPQEAALREGQRSGKERKPLLLSFTTKPTNTHCACYSACFIMSTIQIKLQTEFQNVSSAPGCIHKIHITIYCNSYFLKTPIQVHKQKLWKFCNHFRIYKQYKNL